MEFESDDDNDDEYDDDDTTDHPGAIPVPGIGGGIESLLLMTTLMM